MQIISYGGHKNAFLTVQSVPRFKTSLLEVTHNRQNRVQFPYWEIKLSEEPKQSVSVTQNPEHKSSQPIMVP